MLDFVIGDDGVIIVSLDGQWKCDDPDAMVLSENSLMVRAVKKSSGEVRVFVIRQSFKLFPFFFFFQLIETFETHKSLIESLNSKGLLPGMFALIVKHSS